MRPAESGIRRRALYQRPALLQAAGGGFQLLASRPHRFGMRNTNNVNQGEGAFLSANDQPFQV